MDFLTTCPDCFGTFPCDLRLMPLGHFKGELKRETEQSRNKNNDIYDKMAWRVAQSPFMTIIMTLFMMWMMGSSLQSIINITMLIALIAQPVRTLMNMNSQFSKLQESSGKSFLLQRLVYFLFNSVSIGLVAYKCMSIGLIPHTEGDWLEFIRVGQPQEYSAGGASMAA